MSRLPEYDLDRIVRYADLDDLLNLSKTNNMFRNIVLNDIDLRQLDMGI